MTSVMTPTDGKELSFAVSSCRTDGKEAEGPVHLTTPADRRIWKKECPNPHPDRRRRGASGSAATPPPAHALRCTRRTLAGPRMPLPAATHCRPTSPHTAALLAHRRRSGPPPHGLPWPSQLRSSSPLRAIVRARRSPLRQLLPTPDPDAPSQWSSR